jgi:hypothetical protein
MAANRCVDPAVDTTRTISSVVEIAAVDGPTTQHDSKDTITQPIVIKVISEGRKEGERMLLS